MIDLSTYDLGEDRLELARLVRAFADEVVAPRAYEADRTKTLPMDVVAQLGDLGLFGLPFPEEVGGQGGDYTTLCLAIEALGRVGLQVHVELGGPGEPGPRRRQVTAGEEGIGIRIGQSWARPTPATQRGDLEHGDRRVELTQVTARPAGDDGQLHPLRLVQPGEVRGPDHREGTLGLTQATLTVGDMRREMVRAGEPTRRAQLAKGTLEVTEPVRDQTQGLSDRRDPAGPPRRHLGVRQGRLGLVVDQPRDHDEMLGNALGVLLRQGAQLRAGRAVQLRTGDILIDRRIGEARASAGTMPSGARSGASGLRRRPGRSRAATTGRRTSAVRRRPRPPSASRGTTGPTGTSRGRPSRPTATRSAGARRVSRPITRLLPARTGPPCPSRRTRRAGPATTAAPGSAWAGTVGLELRHTTHPLR